MNIVERDKWYFVIDCERCRRGTVLREAPSPAEAEKPIIKDFSWKCPYCGNRQNGTKQIQCCQGIYI